MIRNNWTDLKCTIEYLDSIGNEIELDIWRYRNLSLNPSDYGYAPRPTAWITKIGNKKVYLKLLSWLWTNGLGVIFIIYSYLKCLFSLIFRKTEFQGDRNLQTAVAFAPRSLQVIEGYFEKPFNWLIPPWMDSTKIKNKKRIITYNDLVSIRDLNRVFRLCMLANRLAKKKIGNRWRLQTYTSFNWFLMYITLIRCNTNLITAEHFDRFAVLMDRVSGRLQKKLSLIQHGIVIDNLAKHKELNFPSKLANVKELYVYDIASKDFFLRNVIFGGRTPNKIIYFSPSLALTEIPKSDCPMLLFVGSSTCADLHSFILDRLKMKYNFKAYYKPHPTEGLGKVVLSKDWEIISDRLMFPKVDFLISYPSTLVKEYEAHGIASLVHSINLKSEDSKEYFMTVDEKLQKMLNLDK